MISYEDVLNSSGLPIFLEERRRRYFDKAVDFCREQFPGRFAAASDADALAHVRAAYGIGKSFGLRSERDHLKLLIATVHWGLGLATDPRLAQRLVQAGWLGSDLSARQLTQGDQLLRADQLLSRSLDGVYRRGEVYLRFLQKLSSVLSATSVGRFLSLYLLLPVIGSFMEPRILGGTKGATLGMNIDEQFTGTSNWPLPS